MKARNLVTALYALSLLLINASVILAAATSEKVTLAGALAIASMLAFLDGVLIFLSWVLSD